MSELADLLVDLGSVFTGSLIHIKVVLGLFLTIPILLLSIGYRYTGAMMGFAARLIHRK